MIGACDVTHTAWKLKWKTQNGLMQPLAEKDVPPALQRWHTSQTNREKKSPEAGEHLNITENDVTYNNVRMTRRRNTQKITEKLHFTENLQKKNILRIHLEAVISYDIRVTTTNTVK